MNSQISNLTSELAEKSDGLLDAHVRLDELSDSLAALSNGIHSHLTQLEREGRTLHIIGDDAVNEFNSKGEAATKTLLNAILRERRDADAVTDHFMFELLDNVATAYIRSVKHAGIAKLAVMLRTKVVRDNMVLLGKTSSARPPNIRI